MIFFDKLLVSSFPNSCLPCPRRPWPRHPSTFSKIWSSKRQTIIDGYKVYMIYGWKWSAWWNTNFKTKALSCVFCPILSPNLFFHVALALAPGTCAWKACRPGREAGWPWHSWKVNVQGRFVIILVLMSSSVIIDCPSTLVLPKLWL